LTALAGPSILISASVVVVDGFVVLGFVVEGLLVLGFVVVGLVVVGLLGAGLGAGFNNWQLAIRYTKSAKLIIFKNSPFIITDF
jgi:hypothetical protein